MAHLFDLIVALLLFQGVLPSWSSIQFRLWNFQLGKNSCKEKPPQPSLTGKFWSTPLYELKNIQCFQVAYNMGFLIYVSEKMYDLGVITLVSKDDFFKNEKFHQ